MRITRVYTRTGDKGHTRLTGGSKIDKDHARIEAYGTVDELNSVLGIARAALDASPASAEQRAELQAVLAHIQNELFDVGADLSTPAAARWEGMHRVGDPEVARLEGWIDDFNERVPPLKEFVLPAGGMTTSQLHLARTVCRRAERRVVTLLHTEPDAGEGCLRYLNRLSDLLFVLARWAAHATGEPEVMWKKPN